MPQRTLGVLLVSALAVGCMEAPDDEDPTTARLDEIEEITENLLAAGYTEDEIEVVELEDSFSINGVVVISKGPQVLVGGDVNVTLEASRALLDAGDEDAFRQWRTPGLVTNNTTICLAAATSWIPNEVGPSLFGLLSTDMLNGLVFARDNYNALPSMNLQIEVRNAQLGISGNMLVTPANQVGCTYFIAVARHYWVLENTGSSGFPSGNGAPYGAILVNGNTNDQVFEHIMTHELGHTIGLRHSDWKTRASCGQNTNEGQSGAVQIAGTMDQSTNSIMAACLPFDLVTNGEFRGEDALALSTLY
jgi:Dual-action HEIGH metallo-peptidase